ncbi:MAG: nucleotide-binding domain-containing protein [Mediterraneibacter sp.]
MPLNSDFQTFCSSLVLDTSAMEVTCDEIAKKLNSHYYGLSGETKEHCYIVGSVGRMTAKCMTSDLDVIFDLPHDVLTKYDNYEGNGQSQLLQEVKNVLKERYPKSTMRGDGQVIVIEFTSYTVELVPGFKQADNRFKYPDTHDGGTWKYTDPLSEQDETEAADNSSGQNFRHFCRMLRQWKNQCGVVMGGLLIDTLCYNHFNANNYYAGQSYGDYYSILIELFEYLKGLNKNQSYWYALGSNQLVYNSDNGSFIAKANDAYQRLEDANNDEERYSALNAIFGKAFPSYSAMSAYTLFSEKRYRNTEQFIEDMFPVDIKYNLSIDCNVTQNGFRDFWLRKALHERHILRHNKSLTFQIEYCDAPKPYSIYWKVRNVGDVAESKDMIRGEIIKTDSKTHKERTSFQGPHFVECYIIKDNVCVARDRIDVPIGRI